MAKIIENFRRLTPLRQTGLVLIVAGIAMVAGLMLFTWFSAKQLSSQIVKISKAGEPIIYPVSTAGQTQQALPAGAEDANRYYSEAVGQLAPGDLTNLNKVNLFYRINLVSLPANQFPADLREKVSEQFTKLKPVFDNLDKGAALALSGFDTGVLQGRKISQQQLDSIQSAVLLLSLRTLDLIRAGDLDKAADSIADTIKLTRVFDGFPTILAQRTKMICLRLVCSDVQLLIQKAMTGAASPASKTAPAPRSISPQRLEMIQTLLEDSFPGNSLEKTFMAERAYQLEVARNIIPKPIASKYLSPTFYSMPERLALPNFTWHRMRYYRASSRFLRDMAWLIKASREPWPGPLNEIKDANSLPSGGASGLMTPAFPLTRMTAETLAVVRCTAALVAVERYRQQTKKLPETLADIQPKYVKTIPIDPFTGRAISYSRDGNKSYKVSSVLSSGAQQTIDSNLAGQAPPPKVETPPVVNKQTDIKPFPSASPVSPGQTKPGGAKQKK